MPFASDEAVAGVGSTGAATDGALLRQVAHGMAEATAGFTGADLICLCQRAALVALQRVGSAQGAAQATAGAVLGGGATDGCGGADEVPTGASPLLAVRRADFDEALRQVRPSVTAEMLSQLERWRDMRGRRQK